MTQNCEFMLIIKIFIQKSRYNLFSKLSKDYFYFPGESFFTKLFHRLFLFFQKNLHLTRISEGYFATFVENIFVLSCSLMTVDIELH